MMAAAKQGETYKALYLARVFTTAKPDLAAGWTNRAQLAASLGFDAEATASRANASEAGSRPIPPASSRCDETSAILLADWAAALALVADDVVVKEGPHALVAVRDDS